MLHSTLEPIFTVTKDFIHFSKVINLKKLCHLMNKTSKYLISLVEGIAGND